MKTDINISAIVAIDDGSQYQKTARLVKRDGQLVIDNESTRLCAERLDSAVAFTGHTETMVLGIENVNTGKMEVITIDPELSPIDPKSLAIEHGEHAIQYDPRTAAMTYYSLNKMGYAGKPVNVIVGMPVGPFFSGNDGGVNGDLYQKKVKSLVDVRLNSNVDSRGELQDHDPSKVARIQTVACYPEGVGAFHDFTLDLSGKKVRSFNSNVLVIDIGSYTTDIAVMLPSGRIDPRSQSRSGKSSLSDGGSYAIYRQLQEDLASNGYAQAARFKPEAIENWVQTKSCFIAGKEVTDFNEILDGAIEKMRQRVVSHVSMIIGDDISTFDTILLAGGGADLLKETLSKVHGNVVTGEAPRFANVNGWLKFALANEFTDVNGFNVIDDL